MLKNLSVALAAILVIPFVTIESANAFQLGSSARRPAVARLSNAMPVQYNLFCLNNPKDCRESVQKIAYAKPSVLNTLQRVNAAVNREIIPRRETQDVWSIASRYGDCDDYVMTKRHRLIKAGLPASALKVAVVRTKSGEGHAVLIVKTSAGELVLDNLRKTIVKRNQSGYRYLSIS